jgi:hypothetical protein
MQLPGMKNRSPFRYFKTSPEIIRLAVMLYVRFPLSLRNSKTCCTSRALTSATKPSATDATASVLYSPLKSGGGGLIACGRGHPGVLSGRQSPIV